MPARSTSLKDGWEKHLRPARRDRGRQPTAIELVFEPDPTIYDGRFANNGWLQELPKPITKLTWDNAALMSPATAGELGVGIGSYAHGGEHGGYHMPTSSSCKLGERSVTAPVWIMPGHADGCDHRPPGLRPRARRPGRRHRGPARRLQRLSAAHLGPALVRRGPDGAQDRRHRTCSPARSSIT